MGGIATKREGVGQVRFYPYKKIKEGGGCRKSSSHAEGGGGKQSFEVVLTWELQVLAVLILGAGGWRKKFPTFKKFMKQ